MALPVTFGGLTQPNLTGLDQNFAALGALTAIPCTVSGTNAVALTPLTDTPTISAYVNYQPFSGIVATTNTGATTAAVGSLAALGIYKDTISGPVALSGGELRARNAFLLVYDSALNSGSGGFHLIGSSLFTTGYAVAGLPAANAGLRGARAYVTDSSSATPTFGATLTAGGSAVVPVFCNGTAWVYG